jgi:hypothetical protein
MSEKVVWYDFDKLLAAARDADPSDRIELRDELVSRGDRAIEAMTEWLGDSELAAFAIRVLERIGRAPENRRAVVDVLTAVDRDELPPHLAGDVDHALASLGWRRPTPRMTSRGSGLARPSGTPGIDGRGYWVMRTSPWERAYIWTEAQRGRLRQGWGWNADMNLETIAEAVRVGRELSDEQRMAWRSRRMRTAAPDGMRLGDIVVAPNLPEWGQLSIFRLAGSYEYSLDSPRRWDERFGHILPVELLADAIDRRSPKVSDGLRAMLRPQTRLYNISGYGGDVERLLGNELPKRVSGDDRQGELWIEREYEVLFARFPPIGDHPTSDQIASMAAELGRSFDAVDWQWRDGQSYCAGGSTSTTSNPLKNWLDRSGACQR